MPTLDRERLARALAEHLSGDPVGSESVTKLDARWIAESPVYDRALRDWPEEGAAMAHQCALAIALVVLLSAGCAPPAATGRPPTPPPVPSAEASAVATAPVSVVGARAPTVSAGPTPDAAAGDIPSCVERASGKPFGEVLGILGGTLVPGTLKGGPLAQILPAEDIDAIERCFAAFAPSGAAAPGAGSRPSPAGLRALSDAERTQVRASADRVRTSSVVVGDLIGGRFAPGGSGFIYAGDGFVMTNSHVIAPLTGSPAVMLYDGRVVPAEVVGRVTSLQPDIGVLRIRADGLVSATIGDSNSVRHGDPLFLVAHPRGYGYWLSVGGQAYGQNDGGAPGALVGQLHSNVPGGPGASGGPLFDARGEVVGVLSAGTSEGETTVVPAARAIIRDPGHWSSIAERPRTTSVPVNDAVAAAAEIVAGGGDIAAWSRTRPLPVEVAGPVPERVVEAIPTPPPGPRDAAILAALDGLMASVAQIAGSGPGGFSQGTGSVISSDGYVLTNRHVIEDRGDAYTVTLLDGRRFPARRVGVALGGPDVGVLKIEATGLQPVAIGDPEAVAAGGPLLLVGHPAQRGFWRVSAGSLRVIDRSAGYAQLWAEGMSFAGGNSGGPLVDERSAVVGVFHGAPPLTPQPIRPSPPEVVWGWHAFDAAFGSQDEELKIAAAVAIDVAMSRAAAIIERQGDVP